MRVMTATEASRGFSAMLDAVERGESVVITRGDRRVAELRPAPGHTIRELKDAWAKLPPLDDDFERDIAEGMSMVIDEVPDRWADS